MSKFAILRNNEIVRHVIMVGEELNYKEPVVVDLVFDTREKAIEVSKVLEGKTKVIVYQEEELLKAA